MTIGICTDSNSQLPAELAERYGVEVVPVTVRVDDHEYLEGVDLDADAFYAAFTPGHRPHVATSQPSPGQFALAYEELLDRGCTEILSVHISSALSGTINSARLAAHRLAAPVRVVDSGTMSFGISCCVWAAGEAIASGAGLDAAAAVAETLVPSIGNVFIVGGMDLLRRSRLCTDAIEGDGDGIPVLALRDGQVQVVERVDDLGGAVATMASTAASWGTRLKVAVGMAEREVAPLADALAEAVGEAASVDEVIRYRIGPSVGAHAGPGSVGCFMFPSALARSTPATS